MNHYRKAMIVFAMMMILLIGCGTAEQGKSAALPKQEAAQETNGQAAEEQKVRVIEHALGKTEIKGTPQKVVTLYQAATDSVVQLGVKPVGAVESWVEQPWYLYIRDQMSGTVNVGLESQPNLEQLITLEPDLIIATKSRHEKIYEQLSAIAPTVVDEDHYHWKSAYSLAAEALNKNEEKEKFMTAWDQKTSYFKEKMGDRLNIKVTIVDFRADHARIFYNTFPNLVLKDAGFTFPDGEDTLKLSSKETIPELDADIIFDMTSLDRDDGRVDTRNEWTSHPLWESLDAVKNNKVFPVDPVIWTNGSGPIAAMKMLEDLYTFFEIK